MKLNAPSTYGNFMRINIHVVKNDITMHMKPKNISNSLLSLGNVGEWVWSRMTYPNPPSVNIKLDARPSRIYCPLTLYGMKAT